MKRPVKSLLAIIMVLALALSLFACGKTEAEPEAGTTAPEEIETQAPETSETAEATSEEAATEEETALEEDTTLEETTAEETTEKKELTKDEIVALYTESVNKVKSGSKSITQNYCENTQASNPVINNKLVQSAAKSLIDANMGRDKNKEGAVYSTDADKIKNFPVKDQTWSSKLTGADVKSATCTEDGGKKKIVIELIDDTASNLGPGDGHAGKAFSLVTKDQIVEGAGSLGMRFIKEESIAINVRGCKIVAEIDDKGNISHVNFYQIWTLSLSTTVGLDVSVSFGLEEDYTVNW